VRVDARYHTDYPSRSWLPRSFIHDPKIGSTRAILGSTCKETSEIMRYGYTLTQTKGKRGQ